jgi:hypothetical protein
VNKTTAEDEYVSVLVPKRHLTRTYAFLGSLDGSIATQEEPIGDAEDKLATDWPPELLERQYAESPKFMKRFQKHLADHPGEEFSTRDMADALEAERGWNTVAGALGAYGRRVKNRYKRSTFPFQSRTDYEAGEVYHSMTPEVAEIIRGF